MFGERGAQLAGISVDSISRNEAMARKLRLPFPLLSDPDGEVIQRFGVWNQEGHIAIPAIFVIDKTGVIRYVYEGQDFADRPGDQSIIDALAETGEGSIRIAEKAEIQITAENATRANTGRPAVPLEQLVTYYRGAYFTTVALKRRLATHAGKNREAIHEIGRYQQMVERFADALQKTVMMSPETTERQSPHAAESN